MRGAALASLVFGEEQWQVEMFCSSVFLEGLLEFVNNISLIFWIMIGCSLEVSFAILILWVFLELHWSLQLVSVRCRCTCEFPDSL